MLEMATAHVEAEKSAEVITMAVAAQVLEAIAQSMHQTLNPSLSHGATKSELAHVLATLLRKFYVTFELTGVIWPTHRIPS